MESRSHELHVIHAKQYVEATTKSEQQRIVSQLGVRYSAFLALPYFNIVRMDVIGPMHNLLFGSAKHMMDYGGALHLRGTKECWVTIIQIIMI